MVAHTCHSTAGRAWEADPWGAQASQIAYWTSPRPVRDTVSKYSINSTQKDGTLVCLYIHVHTQTCTQHTPEAYCVTKRMLLLLRRVDILCALNHTLTWKFPVSPLPTNGEAAQTPRTDWCPAGWPGLFSVSTTPPLLTCLMCRRDLKTESFGGCQFPQAERKDDSVGQLANPRPSAPSGVTEAFSSSSASELSQLSDSSSKSTGQTGQVWSEHPLRCHSLVLWLFLP